MSESFKTTGEVHTLGPTNSYGANGFTKRELVLLQPDEKYPQYIKFTATKERCPQLDKYKPGDTIAVEFNLRGRQWTDPKNNEVKTFNDLELWRHELIKAAPEQIATAAQSDDSIPF